MRLPLRVAVSVVLLALGAGTAVAAVAVHEIEPWGLPLAALATAVTLVALPAGWWLRLPFAAGWGGAVGWLATPRRQGGYLISADWQGYTLLGLALVVIVVGIATLPRPGTGRRALGGDAGAAAPAPGPTSGPAREREAAAREI